MISTARPVLNTRKCPAQPLMCKAITACEAGAISYVEDENEPLGGKILFDMDKCTGCAVCVEACCGHAIEMAIA